MMQRSFFQAYADRKELYENCRSILPDSPESQRALSHVFWENFWCDEERKVHSFFETCPRLPWRMNVQSFEAPSAPAVETAPDSFLRLCVTTNWVLDLEKFGDFENWFSQLSKKNRKNLRWIRNALPKEGIQILPLDTPERFARFSELYLEQFPHQRKRMECHAAVEKIYEYLQREGKSFSFFMVDAQQEPVAANLGYLHGKSFYFTHLTRKKGVLDKFSPGLFHTFALIERIFTEHPEIRFFFMGPGKYDYKPAFLAEPLAVYRYEKKTLFNLPGLIRLRHRWKKECRRDAR